MNMKRSLLVLLVAFFVLLSLVSCGSNGKTKTEGKDVLDGYPDKPVTVLVGFSPGGGSDKQARTLVNVMKDNNIVEQSMQVKNLPGAGGAHAYTQLIKEPDNIYQVMEVPEVAYPVVNGAMDADYSDFQFVAQTVTQTMVIVVSAESDISSIDDLLNTLREDPKSLSIAISGAIDGGEAHRWYTVYNKLQSEEANLEDLQFVPQEGDSVTSVVGGHTDVALENPALAIDYVETGKAKVLAVLSPERLDIFPNAPTLVEKDIDIIHSRARGWWMGKDVPEEIVAYWRDRLKESTRTDDWSNYVEENAFENTFLDSKEYENFLEKSGSEFQKYLQLVK